MKKFRKREKFESKLNPFIIDYFMRIDVNSIEEELRYWKNVIIQNNKIIIKLESEMNNDKINNLTKDILKRAICDIEYQNNTNEEIIKLLEHRGGKE